MIRTLAPLLALLLLAACGGSSPPARAHHEDDEEDDDSYDGDDDDEDDEDDEEDEGDDDDGGSFVDEALLRDVGTLELGDAVTVAGTGVRVRPPAGAEPMPFGAGFLALRQRVQLTVVVAEGGASVLETIRTGGDPNAPEPVAQSEVEISGQPGRLGRDRIRTPQGTLERQWLLVHDGTRGMGVIVTYESGRARAYRRAVRESLADVQWDREADLDASVALGIAVGPVEGLEASHRSTANLVLLVPGEAFPPQPGQAVLTVSPLPVRIPEDRLQEICGQLAARFVPSDAIEHEGAVEDGQLPGCERLATADVPDGGRVVTYAALLFHEGTPILVTATVDANELAVWRPRFASAARTVRVR